MLLAAAGAALLLGGCKPAASNSRVPSPPPAPNVTTPVRSTAPAPTPTPTPAPAVTPAPAAASAPTTPTTPAAHPNNNTPLIPAEPSGGGGNTVLMPSKVRDKLGQSGYQTRKSDAGVTTTPSDAGGGE